MTEPLWTIDALVVASGGGVADGLGAATVSGVSIDTRTLAPGDLFVALKDQRDGHEFVPAAFAKGAAAALVSRDYRRQPGDGLLIRVDDVLVGLEAIARAARARLSRDARVVAVTGSAGKTTTKEMLRAALSSFGPTHAADKSFNNHWGVPLTLARMPAATRFAVIEIGMNHAGEITPLTRIVRPDVAIITTVEAAHLAAFSSVEDIARAKAEIMLGLEPGGTAVLNRDNPHYPLLRRAAVERPGVDVVSFGETPLPEGDGAASLTLLSETSLAGKTEVRYRFGSAADEHRFLLGAAGRHMVMNALAVVASVAVIGLDPRAAVDALAAFAPPPGRGTRQRVTWSTGEILLVDESYNANPASMRAALRAMATLDRKAHPRRIAVLGDMLELGDEARRLHEDLAGDIAAAEIDQVFAAGPMMQHLFARLPRSRQAAWSPVSAGLEGVLRDAIRPGDAVMIKGSNGSKMGPLVEMLRALGSKAA